MKETKPNSIGFSGLLTILFIALKLVGIVDWKWVWVLSPSWISFILSVVILTAAKMMKK